MILCLLGAMAGRARALFEELPQSAGTMALGNAWASSDDRDICHPNNPAALSPHPGWTATLGYFLPFGLQDLEAFSSCLSSGLRHWSLGFSLTTQGQDLYRESDIRTSVAKHYGRVLSLGLGLAVYQLNIKNYGSALTWGGDVGLRGRIQEQLALGLAARNINRPRLGDCRQGLPQSLDAGISYMPGEAASTHLQINLQKGWPMQFRVGQSIRLWRRLDIRVGYGAGPASASAGFGWNFGPYSFSYAVNTHPELGLSHGLTLSFARRKAQEQEESETPPAARAERIILNAAGPKELALLPGIGPKQAEDIIRLRDSLGGLVYLDQLLAVKGMTRGRLEKIAPWVDLEFGPQAPLTFPLDINQATAEDLAKLPGIGPRTAQDIVSYRQNHGPFKRVEQLMEVKGIGRKTFERIRDLVTAGKDE